MELPTIFFPHTLSLMGMKYGDGCGEGFPLRTPIRPFDSVIPLLDPAAPRKALIYMIRTKSVDRARICLWTTRGPGRLFTDGCSRNNAESAGSALRGSGAPDSYRTGLADPPEDWQASNLPAAQRFLRSFRDSTQSASVARSIS